MASIQNATLTLQHDHTRKTVQANVTRKVRFTALELCQIKTCPQAKHFKIKCKLWGADSGLTGDDDLLFTYANVYYFPDTSPTETEAIKFEVLLGEGVLDEDWGQDKIYGKSS